jgi:2-oxoglutarate dehydrogenase E2 component (dihydrolipoamide succinyltransferase)
MLSRRVLVASRFLRARPTPQLRHRFPIVAQQLRSYADKIVKVPEMAESISEGTLKQWSKQIGDFVEQDEEIATIETDKVRLRPPRLLRAGRLTHHSDRRGSQCA